MLRGRVARGRRRPTSTTAVLDNPTLASAQVIAPGEPLPFDDATFDLVVADHVLEHVDAEHAPEVAAEILRVLKPGGWFAARTPNKWGMIGVGARAVPNDLHTRVLAGSSPTARPRTSSRSATDEHPQVPSPGCSPPHAVFVYGHASEPTYFGHSAVGGGSLPGVDRLTPARLRRR